jgi:cyanophycinase-like exopeptidase
VVKAVNQDTLVMLTVATGLAGELAEQYVTLFQQLGVAKIEFVALKSRDDTCDAANVQKIAATSVLLRAMNYGSRVRSVAHPFTMHPRWLVDQLAHLLARNDAEYPINKK